MRNVLLLSVAAALVACSDNSQSTAPVRVRSVANSDVASAGIKVPDAKPSGGSFTQIAVVTGTTVNVNAGASANAAVTCPVGSAVTGGGYELFLPAGQTAPIVWRNRQLLIQTGVASGWTVNVNNTQAGAGAISITAWVSCAS